MLLVSLRVDTNAANDPSEQNDGCYFMENLSESPTLRPVLPPRRTSLARGFVWAAVFAVVGYWLCFIPSYLVLLSAVRNDTLPIDRQADLAAIPGKAALPCTVCSLVFALAAFAHFSARRSIGFGWSLLVMTLLLFSSALVGGLLTTILDPDRTRKDITPSPYAWVICLAVMSIFFASVIGFTYWQIRRSGVE